MTPSQLTDSNCSITRATDQQATGSLDNLLSRIRQSNPHLSVEDAFAVPAWFSNLLVVIGCFWGYCLTPERSLRDAARFLVTFALTTGFFALDMALFQPRYLGLFPRMLHPHLPY